MYEGFFKRLYEKCIDAKLLYRKGIPVIQGAFSGFAIDKDKWRETVDILWEEYWRR